MKRTVLALVFCGAAFLAVPSRAITFGPFGPHGEGGSKNGQSFLIGPGGSVYELDAFLRVEGQDLNGTEPGTAAQLSHNSLPAGMVYSFTNALSVDQTAVVLTYAFSNTTSVAFTNVRFLVLFDAEIDQTINTFFNEYGTIKGAAGHGAADGSPDQWQIDEPGFTTGTLFSNLFLGSLDNSNSIPQTAPNDVAMALGFSLGDLAGEGAITLQVMISENGGSLGSLALVQRDSDPASQTFITLSGGLAPALSGGVFVDANTNGVLDAGEGLPGVKLSLWTNGVATGVQATTDGDGRYSFATVPPGNYSVLADTTTLPAGLVLAPVLGGATSDPMPVTLVGGVSQTLNWGYQQISGAPAPGRGRIQGTIFVDANTNGVLDAGDTPLTNVTVLLLSNAAPVLQWRTDSRGFYSFGNVANADRLPGSYLVQIVTTNLPSGLTPVAVQDGPTNNPSVVTLLLNKTVTHNFAFLQTVSAGRAQFHFTSWTLDRATGSLLGTVLIANTNAPGAGPAPEPFWLGLHATTSLVYAHTNGVSGLPYLDLTDAVKSAATAQLGSASIDPGQSVVLTNAVEVYSLTRTPPGDGQFDWVPLLGGPAGSPHN